MDDDLKSIPYYEQKLDESCNTLSAENEKLKKIGRKLATYRNDCTREILKEKLIQVNAGKSVAAAEVIAKGKNADLVAQYKEFEILAEIMAKSTSNIRSKMNGWQTLLNSLWKERESSKG